MTMCENCYNDLLADGTCPECDYDLPDEAYEPRFCKRCGDEFQPGEWIINDLCAYCADEDWWDNEL